MDKHFEVNLDVVPDRRVDGAGLSKSARTLWGFPEEEVKVAEQVQDSPQANYNMVVDSPKELWDVVGHVNLSFYAASWKDATERIKGCVALWDSVREQYADRIAAMAEKEMQATPSQLSFLRQLRTELGESLLPGAENMTKEGASAMIEDLVAKRDARRQPAGPTMVPLSAPRASAPAPQAPSRFPRGGGSKPMSDKQASLIQDLCSRFNRALPEGFEMFTSADASGFIQQNLNR